MTSRELPVEIIDVGPVATASRVFRPDDGELHLTVAIQASFRMVDQGMMATVDPQPFAGGEIATWLPRVRIEHRGDATRLAILGGATVLLDAAPPWSHEMAVLRGNEWVALQRAGKSIVSQLPGVSAYAHVVAQGADGLQTHRLTVVLDTLLIDSVDARCTATWRGCFPIRSEDVLRELVVAAGLRSCDRIIDWQGAAATAQARAAHRAPIRADVSGAVPVLEVHHGVLPAHAQRLAQELSGREPMQGTLRMREGDDVLPWERPGTTPRPQRPTKRIRRARTPPTTPRPSALGGAGGHTATASSIEPATASGPFPIASPSEAVTRLRPAFIEPSLDDDDEPPSLGTGSPPPMPWKRE